MDVAQGRKWTAEERERSNDGENVELRGGAVKIEKPGRKG